MKENNLLFSLKGSETDTARIPDLWTPALFFFQHYFKVLRLIVPTFFFGKMDVSFEDVSSKSRYSEPSPFTIFSINQVANGCWRGFV